MRELASSPRLNSIYDVISSSHLIFIFIKNYTVLPFHNNYKNYMKQTARCDAGSVESFIIKYDVLHLNDLFVKTVFYCLRALVDVYIVRCSVYRVIVYNLKKSSVYQYHSAKCCRISDISKSNKQILHRLPYFWWRYIVNLMLLSIWVTIRSVIFRFIFIIFIIFRMDIDKWAYNTPLNLVEIRFYFYTLGNEFSHFSGQHPV